VLQKPLEMVWGKNLEKSEIWAREALECCQQRPKGNSAGRSEDQSAEGNVDSKGCACDVSDENKDSTGNSVETICHTC
jgi:hypothetical protein